MYSNLYYSLIIDFVGAILFLLVDRYEPDGPMARLLKFLILFVTSVAILHTRRGVDTHKHAAIARAPSAPYPK